MSEYLYVFVTIAIETERFLGVFYSAIRHSPPYNFLIFYALLFYLVFRLLRWFKTEQVLTYKIIDEREESAVIKAIKSKNAEIIESLEGLHVTKEAERKPTFQKKLETAEKEITNIQALYSEFQEEIIDSHKSIIESIKLPFMK